MIEMIDSHAHYDDEAFLEDQNELLEKVHETIEYIINSSSSFETIKTTLELTKKYSYIYGVLGIHPNESQELSESRFEELRTYYQNDKIVAVGEIGLDYYWKEPEREIQKKWFEKQFMLAKELNLPVVIHSRDAAKDTLDYLKSMKTPDALGEIHCFSYGKDMAREFLNLGYYLGIGGVITFQNAKTLKEVVEYVPLDRILLETDCPYLAPNPYRGKRNSSLYLPFVVEEIAKIKQVSYEEVVSVTTQNALQLFRIQSKK